MWNSLSQGCTTQAKKFNEEVKDIRKTFGADLVGISGQDVASKQKFAQELGLDFSILADEGDKVRKAFKVPKAALGLFPGRVTYVLDKNGVCTKVYDDLANAASHVEVAKKALGELKAKKWGTPLFVQRNSLFISPKTFHTLIALAGLRRFTS